MKRQLQTSSPLQMLRTQALQFPDVEEGIACAGTVLEKRTIKVRQKAFVFIGTKDVMLKLDQSLVEATKVAAANPGSVKVGGHSWTTVTFADGESVPMDLVSKWLHESYRLFAPKESSAETKTKPGKKATGKSVKKVTKGTKATKGKAAGKKR